MVDSLRSKRIGGNEFWCFCVAVQVCALIAAIAAIAATLDPGLFMRDLVGFTLLLQGVAVVKAGCWCCLRRCRERRGGENTEALHTTMCLALPSGFIGIVAGAGVLIKYGQHLPGTAGDLPVVVQLVSSAVASIASLYVARLRESNKRLRRSEAEARKHTLVQRLRHHFLFNTLNTTVYLVKSRPEAAACTLLDLSELFRVMLQQKSTITLAEEIAFARNYIRIERVRLGDRLGVEWRVPSAGYLCMKVPTMVMQPLIENAIYHGVEPLKEGGIIRINVEARENHVLFEICNPIGGKTPENRMEGNCMAQESVRERLFHAYGTDCCFISEQRCGEYRVAFSIPQEEMR